MFPLQRGNELVIQFSNTSHQHKISQDLILEDYASLDVNDSDKILFTKSQSSNKLFYDGGAAADEDNNNNNNNNNDSNNDDDNKKKKMVHREIERQRRKEMATLYSSLRSLLPLQFIKGKRSISDHMNEAVNYIKYHHHDNNDKPTSSTNRYFTLHESDNGVLGIEITGGAAAAGEEEGVTLSEILGYWLKKKDLKFLFLSSKVNGRLVHSVQCEVINSNSVDLFELRRKLASLIQ
ncbi:transcription factor bHLH118-like [Arachis stenosperma]|uniref:transcription factor bHLH118-like n=1 Tax=Arachis stenosperma TaxID=217475 RepID=UPI0025ACED19|nr:transcription factor bHLH118-like [Arachis stenosperma]